MILDAVLVNAALAAAVVLLMHTLDRYEREPIGFIFRVYFVSMLATFVFGLFKARLGFDLTDQGPWTTALFEAAIPEELLKFSIFFWLVWRNRNLDEEVDAIVYVGVIALGFAALENVYYTLMVTKESFVVGMLSGDFSDYESRFREIVLIRATFGHLLFAVPTGALLAKARFGSGGQLHWCIAAFCVAVTCHTLWNGIASVSSRLWAAYVGLLIMSSIFVFRMTLRSSRHTISLRSAQARIVRLSEQGRKAGLGQDTLQRINAVARLVPAIGRLTRSEHREMLDFLEDRIPEPVEDYVEHGTNGIVERLREIESELERIREEVDWMTLVLYFGVIAIPSILVLFLLVAVF